MAPLQQLNLKVPPAVLDHWRAQAAAQGLSVRDWLVSITAPTAAPQAGPGGGAAVADRVARLEALTAELGQAVAELQAQGQAPRSPQRVSPTPRTGDEPSPVREIPPPPDGAITTAELAERTGTNRAAWNNWAAKAQPGDVRHHPQAGPWRLAGQAQAPGGGPLRWLWVPAEG